MFNENEEVVVGDAADVENVVVEGESEVEAEVEGEDEAAAE